jgi:hypothetical protein
MVSMPGQAVEELITEVPVPFSNWDWQTFSIGRICGCFSRLWIAILASASNLAVKAFKPFGLNQ